MISSSQEDMNPDSKLDSQKANISQAAVKNDNTWDG
jgi:hypothetical protein